MAKVHNWETENYVPENPKANDMRFGVGYMNDILMAMTCSMADLLKKVGETREIVYTQTNTKFEKTTLGIQVGILKENYDGVGIVYSKMEQLVKLRNMFIHDFRTSGRTDFKKDAKALFDLINLIRRVSGELQHAKLKVVKTVTKAKNVKKNTVTNTVRSAVSQCKQYKSDRINLVTLAPVLKEKLTWEGKLYKYLEQNGIKTYQDEKSKTIRYIRKADL